MKVNDLHYRPRGSRVDVIAGVTIQMDSRPTLLIGENGAGKTTLLRVLSGDLQPTLGSVTREFSVVYLPQHFISIPGFSCLEYVAYVSWLWGASRKNARRESLAWLEFVGLAELSAHRCDRLSGGQQARLALAAAVGSGAETLLLDEPTASLDPLARDHVKKIYGKIVNEGVGLVVSTHNSSELCEPFERVLVMERGKIAFDGSLSGFSQESGREGIVGELSRAMKG